MSKGESGFNGITVQNAPYTQGVYTDMHASEAALGLGNGGETDRWMAGLTPGEYDDIRAYTGAAYGVLNSQLRSGKVIEGWGWEQKIKNIESGIDSFNLQTPTVFHRGSSDDLLGGNIRSVKDIRAKIGQVVVDKGFTSTSATVGHNFDRPIIYHINTPAGKGIGAFVPEISSSGHKENEFLFNRGSGFKIVGGYEDSNGNLHCNMEYVGRLTE